MNSPQRALAIALVMGIGLAAGFLSYRLQLPRPSLVPAAAPATAASARDAAGEPSGSQSSAPRPVPERLPDITLPDLDGHSRSLRSFGARPLIVNFWATWCAPCRHEIPLLRELRRIHRGEGLEIVGIAVDFAQAVRDYLPQMPIDYPLLIGESGGLAAAEQFGVQMVLPFSVFADARGLIVAVKIGELHRDEAEFILSQIQSLDRGELGMPQARARIEARLKALAIERAQAQQNGG